MQGTTVGSVTDLNGKFKIDNLAAGVYKLSISFVGFDTQVKEVTLKDGESITIDTKMEESSIGLKEMVVVGYGTTAKKDLTGAVTSVGAKDFNKGNFATPEQLLTGKVAGVQVTPNSGQPGSGSRIRIRGGSSLNASNDPLIVIDGVPIDNGTINGSGNPLSLINPNDIENMTILKDASAAAIYGARAANGVIIITTKKE
ncbi:MAG: TonB-dependent receptor plug domain-containing protein [Bacteroidetes bacterium]|nr:TonB-dependent receptor plug domain-containing protein [Bacteroidota bacterium]